MWSFKPILRERSLALRPRELEDAFREASVPRNRTRALFVMGAVVVASLVLQFGELCARNTHPHAELVLAVRLGLVAISIASFLCVRRIHSPVVLDRVSTVWLFLLVPHVLVIDSLRPVEYYVTLLWDLLGIMGVYAILSIPLLAQLTASLFVTVGTIVSFYFIRSGSAPATPGYVVWSTVVAFIAVNAIGYSVTILSKRARRATFAALEHERQARRELARAIAEVKTLEGILPICSYCRKIRNDQGVWKGLEEHVAEHTSVSLSHGLCPECLKREYPDDYALMVEKGRIDRNEE